MCRVDLICINCVQVLAKKNCNNITTITYIKLREVEFLPGGFL